MNTPCFEVPSTEAACPILVQYLIWKLGIWQQSLEGDEKPTYGYQRIWQLHDTDTTGSMSTIDPYDSQAPTIRWMNKARLCADQVGLAEETHLQSIRDPAQYWRDKYRLEQQIMHLLQNHLPPTEQLPVSPLIFPSPPSDSEISILQDRTSSPFPSRGLSVLSPPNTSTPSPQSAHVQLSYEGASREVRYKYKASCAQHDPTSRRSKVGKLWHNPAAVSSDSDHDQSKISGFDNSTRNLRPNRQL